MAEKLYKSHCTVSGHGMRCEVAEDKQRHKKDVSRLRRRLSKKECRLLTKRVPDALRLGQMFNPYDLEQIAQIDEIIRRRR